MDGGLWGASATMIMKNQNRRIRILNTQTHVPIYSCSIHVCAHLFKNVNVELPTRLVLCPRHFIFDRKWWGDFRQIHQMIFGQSFRQNHFDWIIDTFAFFFWAHPIIVAPHETGSHLARCIQHYNCQREKKYKNNKQVNISNLSVEIRLKIEICPKLEWRKLDKARTNVHNAKCRIVTYHMLLLRSPLVVVEERKAQRHVTCASTRFCILCFT